MITEIGPHRVQHGNVMDGIVKLMAGEKADVFYSDPPWGQGNLGFWQTQNVKMTGATRRDTDLEAFLEQVFGLAQSFAKNLVFIEYGLRWEAEVVDRAKRHGLNHVARATPLYRSGSGLLPLHLHVFAKSAVKLPVGWQAGVDGTHGLATLRAAVKGLTTRGGIWLDPCCGLGLGARLAVENGMRFRGNELNSARLAKTIDYLRKQASK